MNARNKGEREIINKIFENAGIYAPKDDCSIIPGKNRHKLLTTDSITLRTHIPEGVSAFDAGVFFVNINLSDIAAMAAEPEVFMASFVIRDDMSEEYISEFAKGMRSALDKFKVQYIGGDTKSGDDNVFTGFCMGEQIKDRIRKRSDIGKDQIVCVTNSIGRVGAAFLNYKHGVDLKNSTEIVRIEPRIHEAIELSKHGARFMMDISDGLFGSISQMKDDYGIGFRIVQSELPLHPSVFKASERYGISALEIGCNIGGDYELLFTIENENFGDFSKQINELGIQVSYIGTTWDGENMIFDGEMWSKIDKKGWDNFSKEY